MTQDFAFGLTVFTGMITGTITESMGMPMTACLAAVISIQLATLLCCTGLQRRR